MHLMKEGAVGKLFGTDSVIRGLWMLEIVNQLTVI